MVNCLWKSWLYRNSRKSAILCICVQIYSISIISFLIPETSCCKLASFSNKGSSNFKSKMSTYTLWVQVQFWRVPLCHLVLWVDFFRIMLYDVLIFLQRLHALLVLCWSSVICLSAWPIYDIGNIPNTIEVPLSKHGAYMRLDIIIETTLTNK